MPIPYIPEPTSTHFWVPKTLAADFTAFLENDIPNTVMDFILLKNWYEQYESGYEKHTIRGEIYPDSTKSRYENTDNNMNFRADVRSGIKKGDMIVQPDGTVFVLDWFVALQSNNAPSRALRCNMMLNVKRFHEDEPEYDEEGYRRTNRPKDGWREIAKPIPCNAYRYDGRPEYTVVSGTPGALANTLTLMTVQYNDQTKNIHVNDLFDWGEETYRIIDISRVGIDLAQERGTLKLQARKAEGGLHGYE